MPVSSYDNKEIAIKSMMESFDGNPAVHYSIGSKTSLFYAFRKRELALFMYQYCHRRNGVHISQNERGIICFYHSKARSFFLNDFLSECRLALLAIGPFRLIKVLVRSIAVTRLRKRQGEHLHCWYLGVQSGHRDYRTAAYLRDTLFQQAESFGLPVCAETTMEQNRRVYERMGFVTYDEISTFGMKTYLMIYFPSHLLKRDEDSTR